MTIFRSTIEARAAQLKAAGVTTADLVSAMGFSHSSWTSLKQRGNVGFFALQRLALALAVPVDVLAKRSVVDIVSEPLPDFDHIRALTDADVRKKCGLDDHKACAPTYAEFRNLFAPLFREEDAEVAE